MAITADLIDVPLLVFNKIDLIPQESFTHIAKKHNGIAISAINSNTLQPLLNKIEQALCSNIISSTASDRGSA